MLVPLSVHWTATGWILLHGGDASEPHALRYAHAVYWAITTLCTVGYGDITPVSRVARMLAVTEAMTGMMYMAVSIARLVALYSTTQQNNTSDPP